MRHVLAIGGILGLTAQLGRAQTAAERATVRPVIEAMHAAFVAAIQRADTSVLGAHYTEAAVLLPQNAEMVRGRTAIEKWFADFLSTSTVQDMVFTTEDLTVDLNTAYEIGRYRLTFVTGRAPPMTDLGKYLTVWERGGDGRWRMARDMFNTSLPPSGGR